MVIIHSVRNILVMSYIVAIVQISPRSRINHVRILTNIQ